MVEKLNTSATSEDNFFKTTTAQRLGNSFTEGEAGRAATIAGIAALNETTLKTHWESFKDVVRASIPTILSMIFFQLVQLLNIYYVGHAGDTNLLAGVGLGNMLLNVCCFAVAQGLNGAIETFVSQSFGAGDYRMCGVYLNRARVIVSLVLLPVCVMFFYTDRILIAIHQDETISTMARNYCVWCLPGVFALVQFDSTKRYLQSMLKSQISTYTQITTTIIHIGWCQLYIKHLNLEVLGAALALNTTYILNFLIQEFYIRVIKRADFEKVRAPFFTKTTFEGWWNFLKLGIPSTAMMCFEWWAFEFLAIFAGYLGVSELSAQVAIINIIGIIFMIPLGVQFAASGLVGMAIGSSNPQQAKRYAIHCIIFVLIVIFSIMILFNTYSFEVASIFTYDEETIDHIQSSVFVLSLFILTDSIHGVQSGTIRALGKQGMASFVTLICYYAFGMPLALYLGFTKEYGVMGFWLGFLIAMTLLDGIVAYIVITANWTSSFIVSEDEKMARLTYDEERVFDEDNTELQHAFLTKQERNEAKDGQQGNTIQ